MQPCDLADSENGSTFFCGVVEGFYGRPWTLEQRKDLFTKLQEWGMNSYLYAPKDDYKHRAYWRELYSVEEAEHLTTLIAACKESNITFFYALSPGLDITYSSSKEMVILKRKLDQVAQFGCTAFALLFDDIEPEMTESDKEAFQSFAQAQVSVTNEIYEYLNQPKGFLFCPTQYCGSRAVPDVRNSEYLNTVGSKLAPGIDVMWTGPKVISRLITPASIDEISDVLRRKPVIWDNLHANDYDQKRLFLGPYSGRPSSLLSKLKGVLTNPNCEYGANFVAIHSLAQWSKCSADSDGEVFGSNEAVSADIELEQEAGNGRNDDEEATSMPNHIYHPRLALRKSLQLWLPEFKRTKSMWGPISKPHVSNVPPVTFSSPGAPGVVTTSSTCSLEEGVSPGSVPMPISEPNSEEASDTTLTPCLADGTESAESASMVSVTECCNLEPMETLESASTAYPQANLKNLDAEDDDNKESPLKEDMPPAEQEEDVVMKESERKDEEEDYQLTLDDLILLCHVFYLPFEHGPQGMQLLQEFNWLKLNSHLVAGIPSKQPSAQSPEVKEWHQRAEKFDGMSRSLNRLFTRLTYINNRELLYELYPYVWDMRGVVALLNSYVKWLCKIYLIYLCTNPGKWIGVILDENKGKNNGTVMAKTYFSCKEGHGMFVRQNSCIPLEEGADDTVPSVVPESPAVTDEKLKLKSRLPVFAPKTPSHQGTPQPSTTGSSAQIETPARGGAEESVPQTPKGDLASKRSSSFIETGFVETLKTQFTPGQALSPSLSMAIEERVTGIQLSHENENLKAEIRDLNEKLETLKVRRGQDKEKLKEADKMRLQLDQLLEFKRAILESQSQLQKELQRVKQEAKDAMVEQQSKLHETDEYQEMLEMATLDKEMAEEKVSIRKKEINIQPQLNGDSFFRRKVCS
nr:EOG090X01OH [Eurycercus lamellatus]